MVQDLGITEGHLYGHFESSGTQDGGAFVSPMLVIGTVRDGRTALPRDLRPRGPSRRGRRFAELSADRVTPGTTASGLHTTGPDLTETDGGGCVRDVRGGEPGGSPVLRRVRRHAADRLPVVRGGAGPGGGAVLRRVRLALAASRPDPHRADQARKVVTIVFADLVGSTSAQEGAGPRGGAALGGPLLRGPPPGGRGPGGRVAKFTGDGVMAVFGIPEVREDDARRALETALALHAAVGRARRRGGRTGARRPAHRGEHGRGRRVRRERRRGRRRGERRRAPADGSRRRPGAGRRDDVPAGAAGRPAPRRAAARPEGQGGSGQRLPPAVARPRDEDTSTVAVRGPRRRARAAPRASSTPPSPTAGPGSSRSSAHPGVGKTRLRRELAGAAVGPGAGGRRAVRGGGWRDVRPDRGGAAPGRVARRRRRPGHGARRADRAVRGGRERSASRRGRRGRRSWASASPACPRRPSGRCGGSSRTPAGAARSCSSSTTCTGPSRSCSTSSRTWPSGPATCRSC